jgi:AMMECR1 domain-containing protein
MQEKIRVEISVLAPFRRVDDPGKIVLGVHGVSLVWDGMRRSVYLPQVATETRWDLETFLSRLCRKGGLPMAAWKDKKRMRFDLFTAEVFHE